MGERKVLNKYYPPDFDPSKIPRRRKPKNQQLNVRTMLLSTIRCETCGSFMYEGTKINARKEDVVNNDTYLGIKKFRFYFECTNCKAEVAMKTDPRNSGYVMEAGARMSCRRSWSDQEEVVRSSVECLESRMLDSKRRMDVVASVEELRSMRARRDKVSVDFVMLERPREEVVCEEEEEDEELIRSIFHVRRVDDDEEELEKVDVKKRKACEEERRSNVGDDGLIKNKEEGLGKETLGVKFMVKRKVIREDDERVPVKEDTKLLEANVTNSCLESLCQYDSDE